jgi:hypothetical protein
MDDVRDALHSLSHHGTFADRSSYDLHARMRLRLPIVTQRADQSVLVSRLVQNPAHEIATHFASRTCYQNSIHQYKLSEADWNIELAFCVPVLEKASINSASSAGERVKLLSH